MIDTKRAKLAKPYLDAFGDRGAMYFTLGLSLEQAQQKHKRSGQRTRFGNLGRIAAAMKLPTRKPLSRGTKSDRLIRARGNTPYVRGAAAMSLPGAN
jgi:hypothetical protein